MTLSPMENWPEIYGLIEIRKKSAADREFWCNRDRYLYLTAEVAVDRAQHKELARWKQAIAFAAAVGLTMDRVVVVGRAAARLWGIAVLDKSRTVELMYLDGKQPASKRRWPPGVLFHRGNLRSDEVFEEHGLRVSLPTRTLRDIAAHHGVLEGMVSMDSARRRWPHVTEEYLTQVLLGGGHFKGIGNVRQAIKLSISNSGSALESNARYLILTSGISGITTLEMQARIPREEEGKYYEVDFLINGWLVVEMDGSFKLDGTTFGKTDDMLRAERAREIYIQNKGRRFIRAGWEHLAEQADGTVPLVELIKKALRTHPVPSHL